jgi:large subunit ribosomal protein L25
MATILQLQAKTRTETGKKVKKLRQAGRIPAVLYGQEISPCNLSVSYQEFVKIYQQVGESTLIDLLIDNNPPVKVLIYDVSRHPVTDRFTHIDFYQVKMTEKLRTTIPLKFVGEAPAVKELGGVLVKGFDEIEVECLPTDLVPEIEVDISGLKTFEDMLHLSDLKLPKGLELVIKTNEVLAKVVPPRSEEELKTLEEKPEEKIEEIKVITEEKKKEKETEEEEE